MFERNPLENYSELYNTRFQYHNHCLSLHTIMGQRFFETKSKIGSLCGCVNLDEISISMCVNLYQYLYQYHNRCLSLHTIMDQPFYETKSKIGAGVLI